MRTLTCAIFTGLLLTLGGCGEPTSDDTASTRKPVEVPGRTPTSTPHDHAPTSAPSEDGDAEPPAPVGDRTPLVFTAQEGWTEQEPSVGMRVAQYVLPAVEGDEHDATIVVTYFGPGGAGPVDQNVERWIGQFAPDDEYPNPRETATTEAKVVGGRNIIEVDVSGRCVAETPPGSGNRLSLPGFRMIAAIVSSDVGPYFVKLVGPRATVEHWLESYGAFLEAIE